MLSRSQKSSLQSARLLARMFSVEVTIRLFGKIVWSFVWPPETSVSRGQDVES